MWINTFDECDKYADLFLVFTVIESLSFNTTKNVSQRYILSLFMYMRKFKSFYIVTQFDLNLYSSW